MEIVEFLRARLDDDERAANDLDELAGYERNGIESTAGGGVLDYLDRFDPARVLADVESKRRIVDWLEEDAAFDMPAVKAQGASREEWYVVTLARTTIKLMALPYGSHPDYDPAWRL